MIALISSVRSLADYDGGGSEASGCFMYNRPNNLIKFAKFLYVSCSHYANLIISSAAPKFEDPFDWSYI